MNKHTPMPWQVHGDEGWTYIVDKEGQRIADITVTGDRETLPFEANADFIVRAVNAHDALVTLVEGVVAYLSALNKDDPSFADGMVIDECRNTLKLAKGEV